VASIVPAHDEGANGGDELFDAVEGSAADGLAGDAEEHLDQVQPGAAGGCEVQGDAGILGQAGVDLVVFVVVVVVKHHVQFSAWVGLGAIKTVCLLDVRRAQSPQDRAATGGTSSLGVPRRPFGVTTNLAHNFPNRGTPSDLGAHGSGDGSTAAFGPAPHGILAA